MLREVNIWKISVSRGDKVGFEVADIEGRGTYHRRLVQGGTDVTPPQLDTGGIEVRRMSRESILESR